MLKIKNWDVPIAFVCAINVQQRPKTSQLSGQQTFTRKNVLDEVHEFFPRYTCALIIFAT